MLLCAHRVRVAWHRRASPRGLGLLEQRQKETDPSRSTGGVCICLPETVEKRWAGGGRGNHALPSRRCSQRCGRNRSDPPAATVATTAIPHTPQPLTPYPPRPPGTLARAIPFSTPPSAPSRCTPLPRGVTTRRHRLRLLALPPPPLPLIPGRRAGSLRQRHRRHHQNSSRRGRHHHRPHYPHTWAPSLAAGLALPRLLPASSPPLTPPPAQRPTPNPCDHMRGVTPALSLPSLLSPSSAAAGGIPPAHTPCGRPRREPSRPCRHRHCCAAPRLRGGRAGGRAADRGCRPLTAIEPRPPPHVGRCPHTHRVSRGLQSAGGGGGHAPLTARGVADSRRVQHLPAPPDPCTARRHTAGAGAVPGAISSNKQQRGSADLRLPGVAAERTSRGGGRRTVVPPAGRPIFFPSPPQGRYVPRAFSPSPRRRDLQRKALRA